VLTLPALEFVTGSPGVANATNRIAILLQNVAAVQGFGKALDYRLATRLAIPFVIGGALGAWVASILSPASMRVALSVAVALVAVSAVLKPPRTPPLRGPAVWLALLGAGFYAGFVQAGVGFVLLACLAGGLALDLVKANAIKVFVVLFGTLPALLIFGLQGQLWIFHGLVLACGNMAGAAIASRLAIRKGAAWIRCIVVGAAVLAVGKLLLFPSS
jgi:uncharacterized membrane protein YfcA